MTVNYTALGAGRTTTCELYHSAMIDVVVHTHTETASTSPRGPSTS